MNSFMTSAITRAFGWLSGLAGSVWQAVQGGDGGLVGWISRNWKLTAVLIILLGIAADLIVYLVRWQPYRVWTSWLRRRRQRKSEHDDLPEQTEVFTPSSLPERAEQTAALPIPGDAWGQPVPDEPTTGLPVAAAEAAPTSAPPRRRRAGRMTAQSGMQPEIPQEAYGDPYVPQDWQTPPDTVPAEGRRRRRG